MATAAQWTWRQGLLRWGYYWSVERIPGYNAVVANPLGGYLDALLRGIGQVMFQNNTITGALFLGGLFYNSNTFALYALLGVAVSTLTAILLGVDGPLWRAGLFGFNGVLVGIAFAFFLEPSGAVAAYVVAGAAFSSVLMAALANVLGTWNVPALTAPFVFATWIFLFAFFSFQVLEPTEFIAPGSFPAHIVDKGVVSEGTFFDGYFKGISEVMFQDNVGTGAFFLAGHFANSLFAVLFVSLGSLLGIVVGLGVGAPEPALRLGLYGFNPVLTGIALGGFFFLLTWRSALYTVFGIVVTTLVFATFSNLLAPWGMPALTFPFVLVTWLFIAAGPIFKHLRSLPLAEITSAEGNLRAHLEAEGAAAEGGTQ